MERDDTCDSVPEATNADDTARQRRADPPVEAVQAREQLEIIIQLFDDLNAALHGPEYPDNQAAQQLSQQVRAEMIQARLLDLADNIPP